MQDNQKVIVSPQLRQLITTPMAWSYRVVPIGVEKQCLNVYIDEKVDVQEHLGELSVLLGHTIEFTILSSSDIQDLLVRNYPKNHHNEHAFSTRVGADDFVESLIRESKLLGSSDIHFEPFEKESRVRMRLDGQMIVRYVIPKEIYPSVVNKIKIKARIDISEKRLPQDGRISISDSSFKLDLRVSVLPTLYGEKIVLRILNNDTSGIQISELGFSSDDLLRYREAIKKPHGIVLISGPTGSGKTTTLYATLKELNQPHRNILTIEDPIEYTLEGVNQVQLRDDIGLGFASAMRTFLRQDPDIIMVGEIRDGETAQMAIRAALTGHLVLSTIHTNSAWGIVARLIDMGIPPYLVANTLNMAVAQRLVRLLCPDCKRSVDFDSGILPASYQIKESPERHCEPVGCEHCFYTGYKGRKAIYEVIVMNEELRSMIKQNVLNDHEITGVEGVRKLADQAFDLMSAGFTSVEEIYTLLYNE